MPDTSRPSEFFVQPRGKLGRRFRIIELDPLGHTLVLTAIDGTREQADRVVHFMNWALRRYLEERDKAQRMTQV